MTDPSYRIEWISPLLLRPYAYNARTHSDEQVEQIVRSIEEFGWTNPILIDDGNHLIAGHGRLLAGLRLDAEAVPCLRLRHLDDAQRRAYVLADNKLAENAGWDHALLRMELGDLKDEGFDLDVIGFSEEEVDNILKGLAGDGEGEGDSDEFTLTIATNDEAEIMALRRLLGLGKAAVKVKAGKVLALLPPV